MFDNKIFSFLSFFPIYVVLILVAINTANAQMRVINGYVLDSSSRETLISATVYDRVSGKGCLTNNYGYFSLALNQGEVDLQVSYVGYYQKKMAFKLVNDTTVSFQMQNMQLNEVTITAERSVVSVRSSQMSAIEIPVQQIKTIPTLFGEADVLKAIQLLPGVQNGSEGSAGMYVRGGGPDENLLLLDGVPVYNVNHMMGFFSVFNPDALKNVVLYKGSFPARFGERLSSVVDIRMKEGNMRQYHGNVSVGAISSKINVEGPIVKDKLSFNFSLRRTYSDLLMKPLQWALPQITGDNDLKKLGFGYYFYDLNTKINWKISDKDRLYLSLYGGDDAIYLKIKYKDIDNKFYKDEETMKLNWKWGNRIASLRWNHLLSSRLFMDASINYTQYRHKLGFASEYTSIVYKPEYSKDYSEMEMNYNSWVRDLTARVDLHSNISDRHEIRFGGNYTLHFFRPEAQSLHFDDQIDKIDTAFSVSKVDAHEIVFYAEDDIHIGELFKINAGLHYSSFSVGSKFYHSLQPRLGLNFLLSSNFSFKAGYAYMQQYIHLLSNSSVSLPTDLWVPVTEEIPPMNAHQVSVGFLYQIPKLFDISLETYYKNMNNLMEYKDGASFFGSSESWDKKVCLGRGWAYGVEFLLQRSFGNITGWVAYTWAHSDRKFDREGEEINDGKVFPAKYDRRHDISITIQHSFSDNFEMSATWVFSTGNCGTIGMQLYPNENSSFISAIQRNNYRFANYHRLDLGFNWHKQRKHGVRTWNFSIYNAYGHNNPFIVYVDYNYNDRKVLKQLCIFPFIPTLSYSFKF